MIKILFYIDSLSGGGAEKVLCTLINHMDRTQFDITVQTLFPCNAKEYLDREIHYKYCYPQNNRFFQTLFRIEAAAGILYALRMRDDYDIEVAYLECGPTKVIAQSTNKKAKKIAWVHCDFSIAFDRTFAEKTKKYYQKYDKIVCVSQKCEESFIALYGNSMETVVLHNVIDTEEIRIKSEEILPEFPQKQRFSICTVGRLTPQKNYPRLLKAILKLKSEGFLFDTWILGEGELRPQLEHYIEEKQLEDHVKLLGFQSNPYPYMKAADLLVCSSSYEGFSTFITEGVILGKRILTTDCSGMHEILDGYSGGMIVLNDDEAFYSGLRDCMAKPLSTEPAGGAGFSKETLVRANEDFFKALLCNDGE